ncbi:MULTISPECIES: glycosyltransferase [unclassified Bradyrhizobium]|uniref:glycosyltransferase family 2 protein n=1 Tax=unclassified Bradyrhizobium TaxID=2631580 RepID=UPI0020B346C2|nr:MULTISPECIES: glycosyltransferase [unclassified Bradyrhizobium]MCP3398637.1 glycosyltransferase [Bradyrhizobium sp. CCGB20]MCP3407216.1 glycosyltransferase [Bradyrhizobium sp. CCGB01]
MNRLQLEGSDSIRDPDVRPLISVATPTFRRPDLMRRTIESVLQQNYSDWEMVISDDEGPEGVTWSMLSEYARSDSRIRVVENHRGQGQVENTNNAMLACRGHWIKVLHDDDWLVPGSLDTFAEMARTYPTAAFMTSTSHLVQDDGIKYRRGGQVTVYSSQQCLTDLYLVGKTRVLGIVPSTLLINSEVIQAGCLMRNYKSIKWGVDQLFFIDLACHGDMVAIDDGLIFYDMTDHESITASKSFPQIDQETLDLKYLTWSLVEDKQGLPDPEAVVRALRVARLRGRFRHQSWGATIRDALQILRPSVIKAANIAIRARTRASAAGSSIRLGHA